ncbi:hypothetical protein BD779DRAFT_1578729 [Infundibulicybe gibba]|nr:hypothetical protein BD779DRAFT_1578729 [Infundibulicybe gibba]
MSTISPTRSSFWESRHMGTPVQRESSVLFRASRTATTLINPPNSDLLNLNMIAPDILDPSINHSAASQFFVLPSSPLAEVLAREAAFEEYPYIVQTPPPGISTQELEELPEHVGAMEPPAERSTPPPANRYLAVPNPITEPPTRDAADEEYLYADHNPQPR